MPQEKAIAVLSGGLDSSVSLFKALSLYKIVLALTFDYGQRSASREIKAASALCQRTKVPHRIFSLPWLSELTATSLVNRKQTLPHLEVGDLDNPVVTVASAQAVWVPNRNGLFINIAACFAESLQARWIITGFNREEAATFPDNSEEFAEAITHSLHYSTQVQARVISLTQRMSKEEIVREALELETPFEILWSCYEDGEKMCGRCESCLRMKRAYQKAGMGKRMEELFAM